MQHQIPDRIEAVHRQCRQMSLAFSWKRTFDRACNVFFPMVMATEPSKKEDVLEDVSTLSEVNKSSTKCIGNSFGQLRTERNGVIPRPKPASMASSQEGNKIEDHSAPAIAALSPNRELRAGVGTKQLCDNTDNNSQNNNLKSDVSPSHLRQLLLLHLDLIQQQQQQIQEKDKEIVQLKTEKEQLEARIKRMERRIAVRGQTGQYSDESNKAVVSTPASVKSKKILQKRKSSITELMRRKSIPAAAPVLMSAKIDRHVNIDTCLRTEALYLDNENNVLKLGVEDKNQGSVDEATNSTDVPIPQFRVIDNLPSLIKTCGTTTRFSTGTTATEISENLDDDTFSKRHQKYEADEKKRKRWDLQHYRALKQREELQEKYKQREEARLKGRKGFEQEEKTIKESFIPNCTEIHSVEMSDTVPVTAFGAPLQPFHSREFDLPWFNLDKRELQEREKLLRTKGRGRRKSGRKYSTAPSGDRMIAKINQ